MLDPLTALGVASNIVQLVGFGTRLVATVNAVLDPSATALPANAELLDHVSDYKALYHDVRSALDKQPHLNEAEKAARDTASQLIDEVNKLSAKLKDLQISPSASKLHKGLSAVRQIIRTHRKDAELDTCRRTIEDLTTILGAKLLLMLQERSNFKLDKLRSDLLDQGIRNGDDVLRLHNKVERVIEDNKNRQIRESNEVIYKSLCYELMDHRRNIIPENHQKTFEWCFNDDSPLRTWLENGHGLFWICGKAGSGKSTFMKFLGCHRKTLSSVRKWAGSCGLVIAEHYFYYAGSLMQKSHLGLLQSLLSQVIQQDFSRNIAATLCPERWSSIDGEIFRRWSRDEIVEALLSLAKIADMKFFFFIDGLDEYHPHGEHDRLVAELTALAALPNVKICASSRPWADFVGAFGNSTNQLRLEDLTRDDIADYARDNLTTAAPSDGLWSRESLSRSLDELCLMITNKAQGVFLWVYIVVSALKELLKARRNVQKLFECVESFPSELEDYFRTLIYERIPASLWSDTAQSLKLAWLILQHGDEQPQEIETSKTGNVMPLQSDHQYRCRRVLQELDRIMDDPRARKWRGFEAIDEPEPIHPTSYGPFAPSHSLFPEYGDNITFADLSKNTAVLRSFLPFLVLMILPRGMEDRTFVRSMPFYTCDTCNMHNYVRQVREYINGCCRDLLWISPLQADGNLEPSKYRIEFLHRTVYDFLSSAEMMDLLDRNTPTHFNEQGFLFNVTAACLKFIHGSSPMRQDHCKYFFDVATGVSKTIDRSKQQNLSQVQLALSELDDIGNWYVEEICTGRGNCIDAGSLCELLEFMISRQLYKYAEASLVASFRETGSNDLNVRATVSEILGSGDIPPYKASAVLLASLGLSECRPFSITQVDARIVQLLLQCNFSPNLSISSRKRCYITLARHAGRQCVKSVWTAFLEAWILFSRSVKDGCEHVSILSTYWQLATLMIKFKADLSAVVCIGALESSAPFAHKTGGEHSEVGAPRNYTTREVLEECIPRSRKAELESYFGSDGKAL